MKTIAIIGGGIVGLCIAHSLGMRGMKAVVVDPDVGGAAASWGNAGHIAVEQVEPLASWPMIRSAPRRLFHRGGALSLPPHAWRQWTPFGIELARAARADRLAAGRAALRSLLCEAMPAWRAAVEDIGAPDLLRQDGHFIVWESAVTARKGRQNWQSADSGTATIRDVTPDEQAQLAFLIDRPNLSAIRFSGSGQVSDLPRLARAMQAAIGARGGAFRRAGVRGLAAEGDRPLLLLDDGERLGVDAVVVAAGIGSPPLMEALGHRVPMIAERGYHIQGADHRWPKDVPPVVFEDRSMIVTGFESGLRAASFVEFARPGDPPDPRKWTRLEHHVAALGLPMERPFARWMGARPTLPDYLPATGRSDRLPGLFYAFGHQHLGLTLSPLTGALMADLLCGERSAVDLRPFDIERFNRRRA